MEKLNELFAALVVYRHNFHILHWKVKSCDFDCVHKLFDDYVDKFNTMIDEVAEVMLSVGMNPLCLQGCIDQLVRSGTEFVVLDPVDDYDPKKAFEITNTMLTKLMDVYCEVCKNDIPSDIISKLDEHKYWLRIEAFYKNGRRLM